MRIVVVPQVDPRAMVLELSPREWRVSDPDQEEHDGLALLGFVEKVDAHFEVTALDDPRAITPFPSLSQAVTALVEGRSARISSAA